MQEGEPFQTLLLSDADRTQTCNLLIRSQMLYSIKLRRHSFIASANEIRITQINSEDFLIKNILPATVALYILQYQPVASGIQPAVASGALPGFSVRAAGRTKNGPEMFRNGPEALQKRFGARPETDREHFGIFGTPSGRCVLEYSGPTPGGVVRDVWRLSGRGRSGADCSFGSFADGPDADRAASGCGYLISRSGCSRRKCSQLCDPLRDAAFLPPPSPLTRSGPRTAWSGLEVV